jgi:PiT family inorganic phosphate transporter
MISTFTLVVIVIIVALVFDFLNGFHDAANAIATVVVSKTLTPLQAVLLAGAANFVGYFTFGTAVAKMVGKGVIYTEYVTLTLIFAALVGAITWNIITWVLGLPTSSSHALIGGLVGSGIAAAGAKVVVWGGVLKIFLFIVIAPLLGMVGASLFTIAILWLFKKSDFRKSASIFKKLQLVSAAFYSVGHGTNDSQKTMGIIALALFSGGVNSTFRLDEWVVLACYCAIALGTVLGGWRIVKTMGTSITKIHATEGFCAETAAAVVLLGTAHAGIPVSTTHVIAGAIMGVGSVQRGKGVRWVTARKIIWAWIITIPASASVASITYLFAHYIFGL